MTGGRRDFTALAPDVLDAAEQIHEQLHRAG
jgi:hypothetical protein